MPTTSEKSRPWLVACVDVVVCVGLSEVPTTSQVTVPAARLTGSMGSSMPPEHATFLLRDLLDGKAGEQPDRRDRLEKKAKFWAFKYVSLLESISSVDLDRMRKEIARKAREDREAALALAALHAQQPPKRQRTKRPQQPK